MKFTLEWLKDYLDTNVSNQQIIDALTMIGLEVEQVVNQKARLKGFVIGHVVETQKHPDADKLKLCKVDIGEQERIQVVCGAPNAKQGMKGVFAPVGTHIPGLNVILSKGKIRGQDSFGMLCSERELELSDDHDSIIELDGDAPTGGAFADYAKLDSVMIDIAITTNRGDCNGVYGIARDLAAYGLGELKSGMIKEVPGSFKSDIPVEVRFTEGEKVLCPVFAYRLIKGVKNGPSPQWMQKRLKDVGLRPINALVDITNYIALDRARPLHVYDADKLKGIVHARNAKDDETFKGLDGKNHTVSDGMCVIADENGVLGLGGVLGGEATGCTEATVNVLIESAWFDPIAIAQTGRKSKIVSDARYRFERIVDPNSVLPGIEMATRMVLDICGGKPSQVDVAGKLEVEDKIIDFPMGEVKRLTGLNVPFSEFKTILSRLGFWVSGVGDAVKIAVPSFRPDIEGSADIVEEIMRMVGVDKVPKQPLPRLFAVAPQVLTPIQQSRRLARRALAARGMDEAVTWSFISQHQASQFGFKDEGLILTNPISSEMTHMRPSLLPGLLSGMARNHHRGTHDVALFEVGQVFETAAPEGQKTFATGIRSGGAKADRTSRDWRDQGVIVDAFDAKMDVLALLDALGQDTKKFQLVQKAPIWGHPGRSAQLQLGPKNIIAYFGDIHPSILKSFDLDGPIIGFEINLDNLPVKKSKATKSKGAMQLSDLMPVRRDFAFVLDQDVAAQDVIKAVLNGDKKLISDVVVFDLYEGVHVDEGKKSLALEVTLQPKVQTLTDKEINAVSDNIVAAVQKATGGTLR